MVASRNITQTIFGKQVFVTALQRWLSIEDNLKQKSGTINPNICLSPRDCISDVCFLNISSGQIDVACFEASYFCPCNHRKIATAASTLQDFNRQRWRLLLSNEKNLLESIQEKSSYQA